MSMRFGSDLFTGLATGFVVASGLALAGAAGSAQLTTTRFMAGTGSAGAVAQASVHRDLYAQNSSITAGAVASGNARGTYSKLGLAIAGANASGTSWYQAFAHGNLSIQAQASANGLRLARIYPYHAQAGADGQAQGYTFQYGQTTPAKGEATAFGTTYFVGHGLSPAGATASASVHKQAGFAGIGSATSVGSSGAAKRTAGSTGTGLGNASLFGDAAVKKSGVRYFQGMGQAKAGAVGSTLSVLVFQQQHALATSNLYGTLTAMFGGKGQGYGNASGYADAIGATTGVTGVPATTTAYGNGRAQVSFLAKSTGRAGSTSSSALNAVIKHTAAPTQPGLGNANGRATAYVTKLVYATGQAGATTANFPVKTQSVSSTALARATLNSPGIRLDVVVSVIARATAYQEQEAVRQVFGHGQITALALGQGYNQVNDFLRAPAERTLYSLIEDRLLATATEDRLITV